MATRGIEGGYVEKQRTCIRCRGVKPISQYVSLRKEEPKYKGPKYTFGCLDCRQAVNANGLAYRTRCKKAGRPWRYTHESMIGREYRAMFGRMILPEFGHACAFCSATPKDCRKDLAMAHLADELVGADGRDPRWIVPACTRCNLTMGAQAWRAWFRRRPFYQPDAELKIDKHINRADLREWFKWVRAQYGLAG